MPSIKHNGQNNRTKEREELIESIFKFVTDYKERHDGNSPSLAEIGRACYTSRANVVRYLDILQARGFLERDHNIPRSIRILMTTDKGRL